MQDRTWRCIPGDRLFTQILPAFPPGTGISVHLVRASTGEMLPLISNAWGIMVPSVSHLLVAGEAMVCYPRLSPVLHDIEISAASMWLV